jgi:hypothetical protein
MPRTIVMKSLAQVVAALGPSKNVQDIRKARDLEVLGRVAGNLWKGRCIVRGVGAGEQGALAVALSLSGVAGLVLRGDQPEPNDVWDLLVYLRPQYPFARPEVRFESGTVPFNPHVLHRDSIIDEESLPREMVHFLEAMRGGQEGLTCYAADWPPLATHDLALLVWQVSRILGGRVFGEKYSLNNAARDFYLRLAAEGRLPLGPPLPLPSTFEGPRAIAEAVDGEDEDVEIIEEEVDDAHSAAH